MQRMVRMRGSSGLGLVSGLASGLGVVLTAVGLMGSPASAQGAAENAAPRTVERAAHGPAAKNIQVGVYLNVQPDCGSGPLPSIRLVGPPVNGTVSIKRGKVSATNYKQCLALEVPGFIAFYQSKPDFTGTDVMTLEIRYPQGRIELQRITVSVGGPTGRGAPAAGQNI
jgi:hypothetical protein